MIMFIFHVSWLMINFIWLFCLNDSSQSSEERLQFKHSPPCLENCQLKNWKKIKWNFFLAHTRTLSLILSRSHTHILSKTQTISLSHKHTRARTRSHTLTHTHTFSLFLLEQAWATSGPQSTLMWPAIYFWNFLNSYIDQKAHKTSKKYHKNNLEISLLGHERIPKFSLMWPAKPKELPTPVLEHTHSLSLTHTHVLSQSCYEEEKSKRCLKMSWHF